MTEDEIADRAEALPERFADRLTESALWSVKQMRSGGEYGLLTTEIAASLGAHNMPVTAEERDELRALLEAMNMPTEPLERLKRSGLKGPGPGRGPRLVRAFRRLPREDARSSGR